MEEEEEEEEGVNRKTWSTFVFSPPQDTLQLGVWRRGRGGGCERVSFGTLQETQLHGKKEKDSSSPEKKNCEKKPREEEGPFSVLISRLTAHSRQTDRRPATNR